MSDSTSSPGPTPGPPPGVPKGLSCTIVILLVLQAALLWTHGSLLQRQHDDIQALRDDVQSLADSLDDDSSQDPDSAQGDALRPARMKGRRHGGAAVRAVYQGSQGGPVAGSAASKQDRDAKRAGREAVANVVTQGHSWRPWIWAGLAAVSLLALATRAQMRRRG